jgi:IS5 family transposase
MEGALYEIASMRLFTFDYPWMALRTGSHISLNFRHLLEQHQLARQLFKNRR